MFTNILIVITPFAACHFKVSGPLVRALGYVNPPREDPRPGMLQLSQPTNLHTAAFQVPPSPLLYPWLFESQGLYRREQWCKALGFVVWHNARFEDYGAAEIPQRES